jgi:Family of unknown function (DUF6807)
METTTTHVLGKHVELCHRDRLLFRYVYRTDAAPVESPRPFLHPVRTLAGDKVTIYRPHDHPWHHGMSMTCANLSGENFWGGPTYVDGKGYVQLPNNGRIEHESWDAVEEVSGRLRLVERLAWITEGGERWLDERRTLEVVEVDPRSGHWTLRLGFLLWNAAGRPLELGSPTTAGRPLAGYGGLFWRGPRSFLGGRILAGELEEGRDAMGERAPWLAFTGAHDGSDRTSTLVFVDHPENPRHPTRWFVRRDPYACVSCSFMFDEVYPLAPGEALSLRYLLIVATGAWPRERIEEGVARLFD